MKKPEDGNLYSPPDSFSTSSVHDEICARLDELEGENRRLKKKKKKLKKKLKKKSKKPRQDSMSMVFEALPSIVSLINNIFKHSK